MRKFFVFLIGILMASGAFAAESVPAAHKTFNVHLDLGGLNLYSVQTIYLEDDDGSNTLTFQAPSNLTDDLTVFTLPSSNGVAGQALLTDGSGNLSYGNAGYWKSVCSSGCDYTGLQAAITGLGTSGGTIVVLEDQTTTGLIIASNTSNLTIMSPRLYKITKSGTSAGAYALWVGGGSSRIVVKGLEFVNWDEAGDYVFYAGNTPSAPEYVFVMECILNSYTTKHNFDTIIVSGNYVYDTSVID
jgi:hypothetical protein